MRTRILIAFLVVVALALTGVAILVGNANANLLARVQFLERQAQIRRLVERLAVPDEVIYWDQKRMLTIAELRLEAYKERGVERFIPYSELQHSISSRFPAPSASGTAVNPTLDNWPANDRTNVANGSFEDWSHNDAVHAADELAYDIESGQRLGPDFKNAAMFDRYLRPYLARMLRSSDAWLALAACKVFVAYGERTEELRNVLTRLANDEYPKYTGFKENGQKLLKKAGWTYQPVSAPSATSPPAATSDGTTH